ncbi:UvrD-helicase domain-containing protein [Deltaproteobacteria bacterium OttesenSCG-928-K17]|nr:UvrD-helicase domain-containing protein [Deltaproteobacteria bacterium OttesenSCG-928-K17]
MHYIDLHIHSRFSRATSPALNPASLSHWAGLKGISLVGTGDLTHPAWLKELGESLRRRDDGFYSLSDQPNGPRFVPTGEVSAIYKQDGRTRKIHLVIIAPDLEASEKFSKALGALGNVESDGRPILGLSARNILEIALNVNPEMIVVPAHIWTPWFSLFGAKSGFDHLEECFGDLSPHITALETGLSSDPAMNRLISALDSRVLISSSDAHSPDKLGREATIINGPLSWAALASALKGGPELGGTVEFFPEEGKYHLDGHLACGPALSPEETKALGGLCPVCGKPLTIGVLHRVTELADRSSPLEDRLPDHHLIPLAEILGQAFGVGPKSKKVAEAFERLVGEFGSEFRLLLESPLSDIEDGGGPLLRLAIEKMRKGEIEAQGGFDGKFGTVLAITEEDRAALSGQGRLFEGAPARPKKAPPALVHPAPPPPDGLAGDGHYQPPVLSLMRGDLLLDGLDEQQVLAVTSRDRALLVSAGPGSGKTRVLVHRAAWLLREKLAEPHELLLTTFTRKAAAELAPRLTAALPFRKESRGVRITTLHGLAYEILKSQKPDWDLAPEGFLEDLAKKSAKKAGLKARDFLALLGLVKNSPALRPGETDLPPGAPEAFSAAYRYYAKTLAANKWWDFDDLILEAEPAGKKSDSRPAFDFNFKAILVDEFQDLSAAQFSFIKRLRPPQAPVMAPSFLTVIGDPDQSIYAFRGARKEIFDWLGIYPGLRTVELNNNYRSTKAIVSAGEAVIAHGREEKPGRSGRRAARGEAGPRLTRAVLPSSRREAAYVAGRIQAHLGVLKLGLDNTGRQDAEVMPGLGLNDIAVIFRLRSLGREVAEALDEAGLAWQMSGEDPVTAIDGLDFSAEKINLLTMHAAKGLEFKLVFVIGAEEGLCPFLAAGEENDGDRFQEEKRLFYVAVTRAKDRLYLTRAEKRRLYGASLPGEASPFWMAIAPGLCHDAAPGPARRQKPKAGPRLFE